MFLRNVLIPSTRVYSCLVLHHYGLFDSEANYQTPDSKSDIKNEDARAKRIVFLFARASSPLIAMRAVRYLRATLFLVPYQIWQRSSGGRTIASPTLHWNASAKAGVLESGALTRKRSSGCGSVFTLRRAASGRMLPAQTCAQPRKKRCSGVKPAIVGGRGLPSRDF